MRPTALAFAVALASFVIPVLASAQSPAVDPASALDREEARLLDLVNAYRASHSLAPFTPSPRLDRVAFQHSADMASRNYFEHDDPDGRTPFDRMRASGYRARAMGENIAAGNAAAERTFTQWRNSPPHDAAMLDPEYRAAGIGHVRAPGTEFTDYWTLDLGSELDGVAYVVVDTPDGATVNMNTTAPALTPRATTATVNARTAPAHTAPPRRRVRVASRRIVHPR